MADSNPDAENPDAENPDAENPGADLPELDEPSLAIPEPQIPDAVIPSSLLAEPVIPPAPVDTPVTRADWRSTWTSQSDAPAGVRPRVRARLAAAARSEGPVVVPEPSLAPEDVVPPESSSGGYRGLTVVIFGILFVLLIGAIVLIAVLLGNGISPFPAALASVAGQAMPVLPPV